MPDCALCGVAAAPTVECRVCREPVCAACGRTDDDGWTCNACAYHASLGRDDRPTNTLISELSDATANARVALARLSDATVRVRVAASESPPTGERRERDAIVALRSALTAIHRLRTQIDGLLSAIYAMHAKAARDQGDQQ